MVRIHTLTSAALVCAALGSALHAEGSALLLGNARYGALGPLTGTVDVIDPSEPLGRAGLDVHSAMDADRDGMQAAFAAFLDGLSPGEAPLIAVLSGVFMHASHGSYLLPIEDGAPSAANVLTQALPLDAVLTALASAPGEALLVLGERGSADAPGPLIQNGVGPLDVPQGVTVIRGRIDPVSRFVAEELVQGGPDILSAARDLDLTIEGFAPQALALLAPDMPAQDTAAEPVAEAAPAAETAPEALPATEDPPIAEVSPEAPPETADQPVAEAVPEPEDQPVAEAAPAPSVTTPESAPPSNEDVAALVPQQVSPAPGAEDAAEPLSDMEAWDEARAADSLSGYKAYLTDFPNGEFAPAASQRVAALEQAQDPFRGQRLAESALGLSRDSRRKVQEDLTLLGFDTRGVDGIFGRASRAAILNWQETTNRTPSSFLDDEQIRELASQANAQRSAQERDDRKAWKDVGGALDESGLKRYLEAHPEGIFADTARQQLAALEQSRAVSRLSLDERRWRAAQSAGTIEAFQRYLIENPEGGFQREAERRIIAISQSQ